jgi:hypothetical protein
MDAGTDDTTCGADLQSDARNCGACGNDCGAGACGGGICLPFKVVDKAQCPGAIGVSITGSIVWTQGCFVSPGGNPTAIQKCETPPCATGTPIYSGTYAANGAIPVSLTLQTNGATQNVFYTDNQGAINNTLWRMSLEGGSRTKVGQNVSGPNAVAAFDTNVVWAASSGNDGTVYLFEPQKPASADAGAILAISNVLKLDLPPIGNIAVASTEMYVGVGPGIYRCALNRASTCASTIWASVDRPSAIAVDDTNVYAVGGNPNQGTPAPTGSEILFQIERATGTVQTLMEITGTPVSRATHAQILVDGKNLYWGSINGSLMSCPKTNCTNTTLVTLAKDVVPYGLAQDAKFVYYASRAGVNPSGSIGAVRKPR